MATHESRSGDKAGPDRSGVTITHDTVTFTSANWLNQNCPSLTIWYSRTRLPLFADAVTAMFRVTLAPGARSAGKLNRWSVYQVLVPCPPPTFAKCTAR